MVRLISKKLPQAAVMAFRKICSKEPVKALQHDTVYVGGHITPRSLRPDGGILVGDR
jgi:hypothetical protein